MASSTHPHAAKRLSRRRFLQWLGQTGAAAFLAGCQARQAAAPITPSQTSPAQPPTVTPIPSPTPTPVPSPTATSIPAGTPLVAIERAANYDPMTIRRQLEGMLDGLGGLSDLVKPGARVGIKTNMTGSPMWDTPDRPLAVEFFVTHPSVVGALGELLRDAGAASLYIMDGIGDESSWEKWGYAEMARPLGAELVNLCKPAPYKDYAQFFVGENPLVYDRFTLHPILGELDVFLSVAKLKPHSTTGVTLSMKNLVGLAPIEKYCLEETDNMRSAFHGSYQFDTRMPRVILDLNRARPIDLAVIDGVITCEGGPGPWQDITQVWPGVLLAGRSPVATDAVSTAVMGYDPEAPSGSTPFLGGDNHLALANEIGLGTHKLADIQVVGPSIEEVRYTFKLAP